MLIGENSESKRRRQTDEVELGLHTEPPGLAHLTWPAYVMAFFMCMLFLNHGR
jgi:hypothetical protein